jgi:flagellar basal body-associated protein FliL
MIEINKNILEKLEKYDSRIRDIAFKAIELSQNHSPDTVSEQIDALIKKNINNRANDDN